MKYNWVSKYNHKLNKESKPKRILKILAANRNVSEKELNRFIHPESPTGLKPAEIGIDEKEIEKAVQIIEKAGKNKKIIIYGDYDIDGLSGTAILWEALWRKGYQVLPFIPDREKGYGIKEEVISELIKRHSDLDLLITVDNGIVANQAVRFAKERDLKVIITDHHLPGEKLPPADAIVHSTKIAGCGVSWFLAKQFGYQSTGLTALGTIGDLLPLIGPNRSFVKFGLQELSHSNRKGIQALKKITGLEIDEELSPWQISFILGPRLNAAGRISDPMDSLRLLCTNNRLKAASLAESLDSLNRQRQEMMGFGVELAKEISSQDDNLILVTSPDFHPGIIGLIAGKLTEEFNRPSIVVSQGKDVCKASARSIPGVDIVNLIRSVESMLIDVGGHPMAAGFSVETSRLNKVLEDLKKVGQKEIKPKDLEFERELDFEIDFSLINKQFHRLTKKLSPFGVGNPKPTFILRNARIMNTQTVGSKDSHLKLWLDDPETPKIERIAAEAIGFGWGEWSKRLTSGQLVNLVFNFNLNRWNGKETLQLKIKDLELC